MKIFVILPTYNEAENLARMAEQLVALPFDNINILVIDDNSQDGTGHIADTLCDKNPNHISVIHRPGKMGLGNAYITGFRYALERSADLVVQMDTDFSH